MPIRSAGSNSRTVLKSICAGLAQNVAQLTGGPFLLTRCYEYITLLKREKVFIHPGSALFRVTPQWCVYESSLLVEDG